MKTQCPTYFVASHEHVNIEYLVIKDETVT